MIVFRESDVSTAAVPCLEHSCVICQDSHLPLIKVTEKGIKTLEYTSRKRNKKDIQNLLLDASRKKMNVMVHSDCRKTFTDKRKLKQKAEDVQVKTRNKTESFSFSQNCLYCNETCISDKKHPSRKNYREISFKRTRDSIMRTCEERLKIDVNDHEALTVKSRINSCIDLIATKSRYHMRCQVNFKRLPTESSTGRKTDAEKIKKIHEVCKWLEGQTDVCTLSKIQNQLVNISGTEDVYTKKQLRTLLESHYGKHIIFKEEALGKSSIVYLVNMIEFTVKSNVNDSANISIDDHDKILQTAANIMKTDIKENLSKSEHYPTSPDIRGEWVPRTVKQFLKYFTDSKVKQESIGQCLVKLITPTVIPPILFGLSVELENLFGSRWLLDELFQLGFGISYSEVTRFKHSCVSNEDSSLNIDRISQESSFTQFIADNVDHNTATLDGSGTFHGMGILASTVG